MPGADSSRGRLIFRPELVFGEAPPANADTRRLRFNSESLAHRNATVISEEIRSDRQRSDLVLVGYDVAGDINKEFTFVDNDWLLEAALCGQWTQGALNTVADGATTNASPTVTSVTAAFTSADLHKPIVGAGIPANSFIGIINSATSIGLSSSATTNTPVNATATASGVTLRFNSRSVTDGATTNASRVVTSVTAAFSANDLGSRIVGTGIPANSYIVQVNSATSVDISQPATATGSGITVQIGSRTEFLRNGVINRSFNVEKGFMDLPQFIDYRGCFVNTVQLGITARQIVAFNVGIMGSRGYPAATSIAGSTTPYEPTANTPMSAGPLIQIFNSGGPNIEMFGVATREIVLNISNNGRTRELATQAQTDDFGRGAMELTLSMNALFKDLTIYNGFIANSFFAMQFTMSDPVDPVNSYRVTLPKMKVTEATPVLGGVESDVQMPISARALVDPSVGYSINVEREISVTPIP